MTSLIQYALGLREPDEVPMIQKEIHRGILDVLRRTGCFVQCINADVPDNGTRIEFAAQGGIQRAKFIRRGDTTLYRVSFGVLNQTGQSDAFAQVGQLLFFGASFAPGEQLQLYAVPRPPAMTDDGDLIEDEQWGGIPEEFQDAVELYIKSKLASRSSDSTSQQGLAFLAQYVGQDGRGGRCADIRSEMNRMTGPTIGPAQLLYTPTRRRQIALTSAVIT